ncbi:MFS transporter [Gryllotalpicola protaetiae]|uniref:MFS transporter n=1 Tax=Gryllotalpicola protaetiae TaxID=2419771 RepID=A0A387BS97_9MICO|nr:MFS transporter [Gryllotalpicola protaetiae]AYG03930.1 MFS transporter [Gryllotalpicola protaetiae]
MPSAREQLGASTAEMGFLALGIAVGSIVGFLVGSRAGVRFPAWIVMMTSLVGTSAGVLIVGVATGFAPDIRIAFFGVLLIGAGNGCCNVVMNVEAAAVETASGRPQMPWFHASYSVGGVLGALTGAAAASAGVGAGPQLTVAAVVLAVAAVIATGSLARDEPVVAPRPTDHRRDRPGSAWREPRTLAIGIVVLGMSFANGSANDWLALGMVDGHGARVGTAALATTVFTLAIVVARLFGVPVVGLLGREAAVRASAGLAVAGILIFILVPDVWAAFAGSVLWGLGVALGFPVAMSAAGDSAERAAARIAVVAAIGYAGSLVGPPVIGFLAERVGILHSLLIVLVMVAFSGLVASALRPASSQ